ncbi:MAG: hypothetical protein AB7O98_09325 [Hyphomonadaceae bacterium]
MRFIFLTIVIVFVVLIAAFALQNFRSVTVAFAGIQLTAPLAVLVALVYILGMATGGGLFSFLRYSIHKATTPRRSRVSEPAPKVIDHAP